MKGREAVNDDNLNFASLKPGQVRDRDSTASAGSDGGADATKSVGTYRMRPSQI